jgi:sec-independent protein translocase protein TatA
MSNILFGPIGPEILIIILVLLLLFGASRLPKLFNNIGKSITAFNEGRKELENDKKD